MINLFKKHTVYIRLYENKVDLRYLEKDQSITRISFEKFSNDRLLIASVSTAAIFIRDILGEIQGKKMFKTSLVVILQPMEKIEGGISEVEKMIFNDLVLLIGGRICIIHPTQELLTDLKILQIINK